jgi:ubiquinone/menaquinone biosynthesis C-methylase UbiE
VVADAIEHCVLRLDPQPGECVLDVATGTGWAARRVAARGATVIGIDIAADLIAAAKAGAAEAGVQADFRVADAEKLPYENHSFDAIISTFGVMFVRAPEAAAAELARMCRKGGRIGLATWSTDGTTAGIFNVMQPYGETKTEYATSLVQPSICGLKSARRRSAHPTVRPFGTCL